MDVFSFSVNLVDQREVEVETLDLLPVEDADLGLVLFVLHVFDHVGEPDSQPVVAESHTNTQV